jgi:hypothetical protein
MGPFVCSEAENYIQQTQGPSAVKKNMNISNLSNLK